MSSLNIYSNNFQSIQQQGKAEFEGHGCIKFLSLWSDNCGDQFKTSINQILVGDHVTWIKNVFLLFFLTT